MQALRLRTNLNCGSCVAAVKPFLDAEPTISGWEVDTTSPEKILTVQGEAVARERVDAAVAKAGFRVLGEVSPLRVVNFEAEAAVESVEATTYFPLMLLAGYLVGTVLLVELHAGTFVWGRAMQNFMGGFFLAFSFFKLLNLKAFAESYRMYDVVAKAVPAYGLIYPFIELALGVLYLGGLFPVATNVVTLIVMSVSTIGVVQSLVNKRKIRCACLGAVFNLPMSTVTLVEDALMVVMAAVMLVMGSGMSG